MFKHSLPNIEQFAAFLDGNLSQSEMQQFSQLGEHDVVLHQLLDASSVVDETLARFTESNWQLQPEFNDSDCELPAIPAESISPLVTLLPEPIDDTFVAAACACDDNSMSSGFTSENHPTIGENPQNGPSGLILEDDHIGCDNDLLGSLPNEL